MIGRIKLPISAIIVFSALCAISLLSMSAMARTVRIPDGTEVQLKLTKTMVSGEAQVSELVPYVTVADVVTADGEVVIPKGSRAVGHVITSKRRGILGIPGKLDFSVDSVTAVNGISLPLRATQRLEGQSNSTASVAVSLLLFWPALFINGKDITVQEGTEFKAWLNGEAMLTLPDPQPAAVPNAQITPQAQTGRTAITPKDADKIALWVRMVVEDGILGNNSNIAPKIGVSKFTELNMSGLDTTSGLARDLLSSLSKVGLISVDSNLVGAELAKAGVLDASLMDAKTAVSVSKSVGCSLLLVGTVVDRGTQISINSRLLDGNTGIVVSSQRFDVQ